MSEIDVSVVIPTFHRERELLEAVGSVLSQEGVAVEVIVMDDSAEGSARVPVESLGDARVRYFKCAVPSGGRPGKVRNDGARHAAGRYLVFLDDDDQLQDAALRTLQLSLEANPHAGMAFGAIEPFGADPSDLRHNQRYFRKARDTARRLRGVREMGAVLVFRPAILINSACMTRRSAFAGAGGYDVEIPVCEDADLWSRIAQGTGYVFIDRPVVRYRTGAPSLMHSLAGNDERLRASYRRIQQKYRRANGVLPALVMKAWARLMVS